MRPGGGGGGLGGRTRADEVGSERIVFFYIHTKQFSFFILMSLGLVDGRVRDDQSFWRAEGEDDLQACGRVPPKRLHSVCTRRGFTLGRSPFKRKWTQKERSAIEAS